MTGTGDTVRIAMWSGPRNISTAMMRSFENRPDTDVFDEPFYGAYLAATGIDHPMREEVLAHCETDPEKVVASLFASGPSGVHYQKHMTHHMIDGFPRGWTAQVTNAFLIRSPLRVVGSYAAKRAEVTFDDLGFRQQGEIFDEVCDRTGTAPPVIDADHVLRDPAGLLQQLCAALGIDFREEMLSWPPGRRPSDGVWAPHWYGAVEKSTGFAPPPQEPPRLHAELERLAERALPIYERLYELRLKPAGKNESRLRPS